MKELKSWILIIVIAFLLSFLIRTYVIQPYRVDMTSMVNTLHPNDLVLVDKLSYRFHTPRRGDIIVFQPPLDTKDKYIKRVIGLPGETVEIKNDVVYIDGKPLNEPYLGSPMLGDMPPTKIPEGSVFAMGDNRSVSLDSRSFGPVKISSIVGKAVVVYWPLNHLETLCAFSGEQP
ncbi:MAG: signal peptidase I [Caldisericaceae bacterium]